MQVLPDSTLVEKVFNTLAPRYSGALTPLESAHNSTGMRSAAL
jgi:hypothetical protein